jgi:hypothetical protein
VVTEKQRKHVLEQTVLHIPKQYINAAWHHSVQHGLVGREQPIREALELGHVMMQTATQRYKEKPGAENDAETGQTLEDA